ncbi:MAG: hypothetical protein RL266_628 [Bacteroidota bacterium]|jgi:SAM-dependent methyltransferase
MKAILRKIYYWGLSSKADFQKNQRIIRDVEWNQVVEFIPTHSKFLDIGCGTGYSMSRAIEDRKCECLGIDPVPNFAGVEHRLQNVSDASYRIERGVAESIPTDADSFDVVYSSHVLEHVQDENKALKEMIRVVKQGGTIIIGVPTSTMALIRLFSTLLFETHRNLIAILLWPFKPSIRVDRRFLDLIVPPSHGQPNRTILFDLLHYRVDSWRKLISTHLTIERVLHPALYPFPDYKQLFKLRTMKNYGSSVFFICKAHK